jgi:hypothetical protein
MYDKEVLLVGEPDRDGISPVQANLAFNAWRERRR